MTDTRAAMTLGNMRSLGVRSLDVHCHACDRRVIVPAGRWSDEVEIRRLRFTCLACGARGRPIDVRPDWTEMPVPGSRQGSRARE
ncbi:hypothetical protein RHODGE_RHODGE_02855 [Rhodoplanes serenus]|uniref:Uncharacterized protein n=1 Tax=Rhodoplanes serenus TaxID=200615 RepID=A0A447CWM4_9BRAD|nr:hypothetical protein [Rhodoplanes serenus]VCU09686.1 hypothetical protein RHODGE_RHODGE_02855 [Rhodoplanes serenus]